MPRAQDATTWSPQLKRKAPTSEGPVIWTRADRRDGSRPVEVVPEVPQGLIFQESFDDQPDWTSTSESTLRTQTVANGFVLPENWYGIYQSTTWSPETGYPNNHASLEILTSNSDKARGGTGKSAVHWRESLEGSKSEWKGDSQLVRLIPETQSIYVEFWISFSDNWWHRNPDNFANWASKLFRIGHWDGEDSIFNGALGHLGPVLLWDYKRDQYGMINTLSFRGGHGGGSYAFVGDEWFTDAFRNYTSSTAGQEVGGTDPQVTNKIDGGFLVDTPNPTTHEQVFGPVGHWTKMAFYLQMNSSVGSTDGIFSQYMDGQRIWHHDNVPWVVEGPMVGWNYVGIGGNHYFTPFPETERFEDWYAMDDIVCQTSLPEELQS